MNRALFLAMVALILLLAGCHSFDRDLQSVVCIQIGSAGRATGVIVSAEPGRVYVLTCGHAMALEGPPLVRFHDGRLAGGQWVARSETDDLALLSVYRRKPVHVAPIGTRARCTRGRRVILVGFPTSLMPHWTAGELIGGNDGEIVSNAWACGGYSGGPLFDRATGEVLGLHVAGKCERISVWVQTHPATQPARGVGFVRAARVSLAVPCWRIRRFLRSTGHWR